MPAKCLTSVVGSPVFFSYARHVMLRSNLRTFIDCTFVMRRNIAPTRPKESIYHTSGSTSGANKVTMDSHSSADAKMQI
jgi:hypothetical protein